MKVTTVLVPAAVHDELTGDALRAGLDVDLLPYTEDNQPTPGLEHASAVLRWIAGKRYAELVANGPKIRWLHTASAGVDHVLKPEVRAKKELIVTDSGPAFSSAIPEYVLAWMLLVSRRLPEQIELQKRRVWQPLQQRELAGATVGIIGLGPIGQGVAIRAKAFGMRVLGLRRTFKSAEGVDEVLTGADGLRRILADSDYLVLATALTGETKTLIGAPQLAQMKPTAWLINIARGALVDQDALLVALTENRIGGACLDVFAQEPLPPGDPLWELPNAYISPHNSGGDSPKLRERQKSIFIENLRRFLIGAPLENVVDIERGY